ncbi:unnamed protein product [Pocillopora meandrina]|uniref:Uncharacterized protein n=1 Tax=Pocillopora meandrina TaxID=46732 RepID=A0AAU9XES8_9CNID|nr:unnamed protein product [Pocillopora meandrina]
MTSRKGKHDYSFTNEYFGLRFPHSTSVKVANWDSRLCIIENTKWRAHVHVTIRVKRANVTTAYYTNSTSTFRPIIQLLHDVELNPGPANSSIRNKSEKSNGNVKIAHLNVRSLKCREHFVLVKETVLENKFDIFTVSETWLNSSVTDLEIEIPGYVIYRIDRQAKIGGGVCAYVSRNYRTDNDVSLAPWSIVDVFDDVEDKLYALDSLFTEILDRHAPVKTFKARCKPNPCVTDNIRGLMKTRDDWRKKAKKTNDPLSWTAYRYFRQEVKGKSELLNRNLWPNKSRGIQITPIISGKQFASASPANLHLSEHTVRATKLLQTNLISFSYLVRALLTKLRPWLMNAT